ncbi:glutathione S-transferase N-terminal domain-containing protein [Planomonospora sp. ID91781]|uniref:NrdH-redoxin n=1 Tax=Planomonospora sphaerica TaxID=161355 RepID=A0A161MDN7_9ACTN|nr:MULTISPECIES: glutaredoxin domain-containing protein [Planomonospora]MBG0822720.1 glutathione S-transferase N-terminal domain-containing protein [Planomonospora sp. ID91781]GAT69793.1 nrdH-redoxin [Planomonospora sphaerica]
MSPSAFFLLVLLALLTVTNLPRRGRAASHRDADHGGVVVYWRPGCPYCMRLRTRLRFTRLRYSEVNIWKDPEAAAFVRSVADGNETVPTVTVAGRAMVNPSKSQVLEAAGRRLPASGGRERDGDPRS